jgi:pseudouridine synthase
MLHKPRGYVTTLSDPEGRRTIRDLLPELGRRVYPVGRLDYQSEGLLLLTDDGALARDLMHPSRRVPRTYLVRVRGVPDGAALARLAAGPAIEGRRTSPARVRRVPDAPDRLEITLTEGKNHQVRKMLQAIGHPVMRLKRLVYGGVRLGTLAPGSLRALRPEEVARLRRACRERRPGRN